MSNIYWIVGGILLLLTGRKLYWLSVAILGFVLGMMLSSRYIEVEAVWVHWLIAIGCGVLGGILAVSLQKLAVGAAGFIAGGSGLVFFLDMIGVNIGDVTWPYFLVGGIVGTVLVIAVFEYALILLSSIAGATLVSQYFHFADGLAIAAFLVLVALGILMQWAALRAESRNETT